MKFSENWLREWVPQAPPTADLIRQLTMAGLEVEAVEPAAPKFRGVVVALVKETQAHPDSDHLNICQVDDGSGSPLQIVCGAANVRPGLKAPLARIDAELPGGLRIRPAKLRGVASAGMLCSATELGLADSRDGLLELAEDAPVGTELWTYYRLDDQSLELNITPNRGDCLSLAGVAREVALLNNLPAVNAADGVIPARSDAAFPVQVSAPAACPVYVGRVVTGVNPQARTPLWMLERLRRSGIRGISPLVDVTNYVMLELGQPMHAFDLDTLHGGIEVRQARSGETITLLDGQELQLNATTLVIADAQGPLAMAGIMGGLRSGVTENTRNVFLESAYFAQPLLAGQARTYGLQTDSSYRFERGVDFELQVRAMERATELLLGIVGGVPGPLLTQRQPDRLPARSPIRLTEAKLQRLLGCSIPRNEVTAILQRLGFAPEEAAGAWNVTPPSFRFDIQIEADVIEEVIRVRGYDSVPNDAPHSTMNFVPVPEDRTARAQLRVTLVERGFQEAITYSFVDPQIQSLIEPELAAKRLLNPIAADMAVMRTSLWPGLLQALLHNFNRQSERVRLFESGLIFVERGGELQQTAMLGGVTAGQCMPEQWAMPRREADFFDLKADVEALLPAGTLAEFTFTPTQHPALHPGQAAALLRGTETVGWFGRLHPRVQHQLGLSLAVFLFQLRLDALELRNLPRFTPLSKFPHVRRDISIAVDQAVTAAEVSSCIRGSGTEALTYLNLFDVYQGVGLEAGKKSLAVGLIFQGTSSTLTDSDVDTLIDAILSKLKQEVGAVLRS